MLHYLEPPDILQHRLPCLTYSVRTKTDPKIHFDILLAEDAFQIDDTIVSEAVRTRFLTDCADIVVGNPPWGSPRADVPDELRSDGGVQWCEARGFSLGDKERSQSFIHRSLDLLRPNGRAGLLVSTGVFFKRGDKTRKFREQWLTGATLQKVINFAAVRDAYFQNEDKDEEDGQGSIAPFAAVIFDNVRPKIGSSFSYWAAKETALIRHVKAVVLNRADFCYGVQDEFLSDETLWKIYWWGTNRDRALIQRLRLEESFKKAVDPDESKMRVGFQVASRKDPSDWLLEFKVFPTKLFERYSPMPSDEFEDAPTKVHRRRERFIYEGPRLLIKRGIDQSAGLDGQIAARFETKPFAFKDSIHCVPVSELGEDKAKVLLAILWSSLTRYYLFLTSGTWGLWHDEVKKDVLYSLPVRFPKKVSLQNKIVRIVDTLREIPPATDPNRLFADKGIAQVERAELIRGLEGQLDQVVFDLFELTDVERECITELCTLSLDLYYKGMESEAVQPLDWPDTLPKHGRLNDLMERTNGTELGQYLTTYLKLWEPHLKAQRGCLRWRIIRPTGASSMLATIFQSEENDNYLSGS
ncbi:MAG: N-6 DNA methylase [Gemmatales bacterium]